MFAMEFSKLIRDEAAWLYQQNAAIHTTWVHRDQNASSQRAGSDACDAFHTYVSAIDRYFDRACNERRYAEREVIEFAICFLEVGPYFFRSGGTRECKYYCRLAARVATLDLVKQLQFASVDIDSGTGQSR